MAHGDDAGFSEAKELVRTAARFVTAIEAVVG